MSLSRQLRMGLLDVEALPYDKALLTDLRLAVVARSRAEAGLPFD